MFLTAEARKQRLAKSRLDQWLRSSDLAGACVRSFTVLSYECDGSSILALVFLFLLKATGTVAAIILIAHHSRVSSSS